MKTEINPLFMILLRKLDYGYLNILSKEEPTNQMPRFKRKFNKFSKDLNFQHSLQLL